MFQLTRCKSFALDIGDFFQFQGCLDGDIVVIATTDVKCVARCGQEVLNLVRDGIFFIGRGIDYAISLEASLKLKEISYIHSEAYPAGELKHGTISLIEDGTPVIALISANEVTAAHTRGNIAEVVSRGANILTIVEENMAREEDDIVVNQVHPYLSSIAMVIPTQLIAYYASLQRGLDVDKPRNLAKAVTVE